MKTSSKKAEIDFDQYEELPSLKKKKLLPDLKMSRPQSKMTATISSSPYSNRTFDRAIDYRLEKQRRKNTDSITRAVST